MIAGERSRPATHPIRLARGAVRQSQTMDVRKYLREVKQHGVLLLTDLRLPSLVQCVTGKPAVGSWWSHPRGKEIFAASEALAAHRDVVVVKLLCGKVTFVHRRLWPALWSIATARDPWQTDGLSKPAVALLRRIDDEGELADESSMATTRDVDELEARLLVHARQVHTSHGRHERSLRGWDRWAHDAQFEPSAMTPLDARAEFEAAVPAELASAVLWPWSAATLPAKQVKRRR